MTTEELHPLTDLFLRRAASNPEEVAGGRWRWVLERIQTHGSQADKDAVQPVYNKLRLDGAHREMMKELLNPETGQEDLFSTQNQALAKSMAQTTQAAAARILADAYQNQIAHQNQGLANPMQQKLHATGDIEYTGSLRKVSK